MGLFDFFKKPSKPSAVEARLAEGEVASPVTGTLVGLSGVSDPVFESGAMGAGCGVRPEGEVVYAPASGTLTAVGAPNYHAVGLLADDGAEVLIHVGVDTVEMNGDGFVAHVEKGAHVSAGEPLLGFSSAKIRAAGHDDVVIMVITNTDDYASVELCHEGSVSAGAPALRLSR